ncbi:hypothetical protein GGR55DRAFT_167452 [Xylaria sp. FL0064]|nr:hypothetical protein GGR55DRAFT_167452 [Xylaria sp. FL0064]
MHFLYLVPVALTCLQLATIRLNRETCHGYSFVGFFKTPEGSDLSSILTKLFELCLERPMIQPTIIMPSSFYRVYICFGKNKYVITLWCPYSRALTDLSQLHSVNSSR